ncbi:hypothetical protein RhiirA5_421221 [Rhizophagus irregularis]|uniref:Uncharacterized protein n=1 Tax=Rhizophagus irregularis TaxID=588596 RepID=A0A2N0PED8_9GLOM|nr:hypothetical protein RhiirA5_421221 [Rhizophagus irregularis]
MLINEEEKNNDISKGYGISPPPISAEPRMDQNYQNYNYETKREFDEAEEYRKANLSSVKNNPLTTHPQAIYTSR